MSCSPRILIIGHARHGKDTVAEILRDDFGYSFVSSSWFCAERVVRPYLASHGVEYADVKACYDDRANHRDLWHRAIAEYNTPDLTRLGRQIWTYNNIYVGLRSAKEWAALRHRNCYDVAIWVDRSQHQPEEPITSSQMRRWMADYSLDNNGTLEELSRRVGLLMKETAGFTRGLGA